MYAERNQSIGRSCDARPNFRLTKVHADDFVTVAVPSGASRGRASRLPTRLNRAICVSAAACCVAKYFHPWLNPCQSEVEASGVKTDWTSYAGKIAQVRSFGEIYPGGGRRPTAIPQSTIESSSVGRLRETPTHTASKYPSGTLPENITDTPVAERRLKSQTRKKVPHTEFPQRGRRATFSLWMLRDAPRPGHHRDGLRHSGIVRGGTLSFRSGVERLGRWEGSAHVVDRFGHLYCAQVSVTHRIFERGAGLRTFLGNIAARWSARVGRVCVSMVMHDGGGPLSEWTSSSPQNFWRVV